MKRRITLLITIMLMISSVMTYFVPVHAEDETVNTEETTVETEVVSEEQNENEEEVFVVEEEQSGEAEVPAEENVEETETTEGTETETTAEEETVTVTGDAVEETEEEKLRDDDELTMMEEEIPQEADAEIQAKGNPAGLGFSVKTRNNPAIRTILKVGTTNGEDDPWTRRVARSNDGLIEFIDSEGNVVATYYGGGITRENTIYLDTFMFYGHEHGIEIDVRKLVDDKVPNGVYTVRFSNIKGYDPAEITFDSAAKKVPLCEEAPDDITASFNENGDLVVNSANKDWLKSLAAVTYTFKSKSTSDVTELTERKLNNMTATIGGGYVKVDGVEFRNTGTAKKIYEDVPSFTDDEPVYAYDAETKTVVVPAAVLTEAGISPEGRHSVSLSGEGYLEYYIEQTEPYDGSFVTARTAYDGTIIIDSTDADTKETFINNLTMVNDKRTAYVGVTGKDGKVYGDQLQLSVSGNARINAADFKAAFDNRVSGSTELVIKAKGFDPIKKSIVLPYIVAENFKDNGSVAVLEVAKTYEVKDANVLDWIVSAADGTTIEDSVMTVVPDGNKITITPHEVGQFALAAHTGENYDDLIRDELSFSVTAEGLKVERAAGQPASVDTFVGAADVQLKAVASILVDGETKDVTSSISYKIEEGQEEIADIDDNGVLNFKTPGTVNAYAYIGDKQVKVTYKVYNYDPTVSKLELTATSSRMVSEGLDGAVIGPEQGEATIEVGDRYAFTAAVAGKEVEEDLTIKSSSSAVMFVSGNAARGMKAGKATITVTYNDLGKEKKASKTFTVINKIFNTLIVDDAYIIEPVQSAEVQTDFEKEFAAFEYDETTYNKLKTITTDTSCKQIQLSTPYGHDKYRIAEDIPNPKYVSSDTNVATVSATGLITIKKGGQVTITVSLPGNPTDISQEISLRVVDLTPRLSTTTVTLNKYEIEQQSSFQLREAYKDYEKTKTIESVSISGVYDVRHYADDSELYAIDIQQDKVDQAKSGTEVLTVKMTDGTEYKFDMKINVVAKLPSISVKTSGTYNTFTGENDLAITYTSKDLLYPEMIEDVKFPGWASFTADEEDHTTGTVTLNDPKVKKGVVQFEVFNYNVPVEKKVSFKVVSTKPTVKLETPKLTVYKGAESEMDLRVRLIDGKKNGINGGTVTVDGLGCSETVEVDEDGYADFTITNLTSGTVLLKYKGSETWNGTVDLKLSVKVTDVLPKAKLSTTSFVLSQKYLPMYFFTATTNVNTEPLTDIRVDDAETTFEVTPIGDRFMIIADDSNVKVGTYKVKLIPSIESGDLAPVTVTVKVKDIEPKVSVKTKSIKLNKQFNETVSVPTNIAKTKPFDVVPLIESMGSSYITDIEATSVSTDPAVAEYVDFTYNTETKAIEAALSETGKAAPTGKYVYELRPIYAIGGTAVKPIKFTVNITEANTSFKTSFKYKLNPMDENSAIVSKKVTLSGVTGTIAEATTDSAIFDVELNEDGLLEVSLKDRSIKDGSYTFPVTLSLEDNDTTVTSNVKVKVKRVAPKLYVNKTSVNIFDTTNDGASIDQIPIKITSDFGKMEKVEWSLSDNQEAIGVLLYHEIDLNWGGKFDNIFLSVKDGSKLKSGSTTTLTVKVYFEGDYLNKKAKTFKITIKDVSGKITAY